MAYTVQNFQSGSKLYASQLNAMDEQILDSSQYLNLYIYEPDCQKIDELSNSVIMTYQNRVVIYNSGILAMHVKVYKVKAGQKYRIFANTASLNYDVYPLAVFAKTRYDGSAIVDVNDVIIEGGSSKTPKSYSVEYTPEHDGYIYIQIHTQYDNDMVLRVIPPTWIDSSYIGDYSKSVIMQSGDRYVLYNNSIAALHVKVFSVTANKTYRIVGSGIRINSAVYPLASFSTALYDGSSQINIDTIIIAGGESATEKDYDVSFTPTSDGYVEIMYHTSYANDMAVRYLQNAEKRSKSITDILGYTEDTIKIQAFGDSITDDSWRSDGTTWLTLLPKYIPEKRLEITNSAVGGSHIGHGKVTPSGTKYPNIEYNYVHDLMTNTAIFKPDSDIITVFIGTNDFNSGVLGEWGDNTVDTFYGGARLVCEHLANNTSALVVFVTPIARPDDGDASKSLNEDGVRINGYGKTLRDYCDAIVKTANFYGYPVIDLNHDLGWNSKNIRSYLDSSGIHPSAYGAEVMCRYMSRILKQHMGI